MSDDWFRNTTWNDEIEQAFEAKLGRARMKQQYLRIQACTLAPHCPEVALRLSDRYFEFPVDIDRSQAFVDRATAFLALGRVDDAVHAYESALAREAEFQNCYTDACFALPLLIATQRIRARYDQALEVLAIDRDGIAFPLNEFRRHAAIALIGADLGEAEPARVHARAALEMAAIEHSGLRYHPTIGLVGDEFEGLIRELESIRDGS